MYKSLIFSFLIVLITACGTSADKLLNESSPVPVLATTPQVTDITLFMDSIGRLKASVELEIRPQVSGSLKEVLIHEGQEVKEGDLLFQLDPELYLIKMNEARAQYENDKAAAIAVRKKFERYSRLSDKDFVSQTELDESASQVERADANVKGSLARWRAAKLDVSRCSLVSPLAGRVGKLDVSPGQIVERGEKLVSVAKLDPLLVEFKVTEQEAPLIKKGASFELSTLYTPACCAKGQVTFLDNQFEPSSGLLLVRGNLSNSERSMRPGQSVGVRVPYEMIKGALLIPQKAVKGEQGEAFVYVVQEDLTVGTRPITLGVQQDSMVAVLEGLTSHDLVITDGHLRLSVGHKVEVQP